MEGSGIKEARELIDRLDDEIMRLLGKRLELCRKIGLAKKRAGTPLRDLERERQVLERAGRYRKVFEEIIRLCVEEQRSIE